MNCVPIETAVRALAYLKTPDRVQAGVRNTYGVTVPLDRIGRILAKMPKREPGGAIGEPTERDGWHYDLRRNRYEPVEVPPAPKPVIRAVFKKREPMLVAVPAPSPRNPYVGPFEFNVLAASVGRDFGVSAAEIIGKGRFRKLMLPRLVLTKLCLERGMSCSNIARRMGGRDHTTIMHQRDIFDVYAVRYPAIGRSYLRHVQLREEARQMREVAA